MINETEVAVWQGAPYNPGKGKIRAEPGTAKRRMAAIAEKLRNPEKGSDIPEDHSQVKHPPAERMLLPVVPGLDLAVVIPPFTETEHKSTEPPIAPVAQLATAVSSKDHFVSKRCQGKQLPM